MRLTQFHQGTPSLSRRRRARTASIHRTSGLLPVREIALTNLAYALTVHRKAPAEALPFARRALALSPDEPAVLDTLAWIEHLLGNSVTAAERIRKAAASAPSNPAIRLHAAAILAAVGARAEAETHFVEALRLRPDYATSEDVARMRLEFTTASTR